MYAETENKTRGTECREEIQSKLFGYDVSGSYRRYRPKSRSDESTFGRTVGR